MIPLLYGIGLLAYSLFNQGKRIKKAAIPLAKNLANTGYERIKDLAPETGRKCPFCAETIKKEAIICRFCNNSVTPVMAEDEKPKSIAKEASAPIQKTIEIEIDFDSPETGEPKSKFAIATGLAIVAALTFFILETNNSKQKTIQAAATDNQQNTQTITPSTAPAPTSYMYPIEAFTVVLVPESSEDDYLQVAFSLVMTEGGAMEFSRNNQKIRNNLTLLLSSKRRSELLNANQKIQLSGEILDEIKFILKKAGSTEQDLPSELLYTSFIIQK